MCESKKIIVYGAGMIGQIIIPFLVREYNLYEDIECFVDMDRRKIGHNIVVDNYSYEIKHPEHLNSIDENHILLITNSKFLPILKFLDGIKNLDNIEGYIVPIIQIESIKQDKSIKITHQTKLQIIPKTIHYCWFGGNKNLHF